MKKTRVCSISIPEKLLSCVDHARKDVTRSRFILRILEKRFAEGDEI